MAITTQQQSNIIALTVGMFNAAPGAQYLTEFANIFENNGQSYQALADALASTNQYQSQFNGIVTSDGRIDKVLSNLGIQSGTDAYTTAKAHFEARIAEGATETELVVESLEYLLGDDTATEFADVKAQLENKVEVATFYSVEQQQSADNLADLQAVVSSVTADDATVEAAKNDISNSTGETFTLTTNVDNLAGTAGNDTFIGDSQSMSAADTISGGSGNDIAKFFINTDESVVMSGVETVELQASAASNFTASNVTDVDTFVSNQSTADLEITGITNNAALKAVSAAGNATDDMKVTYGTGALASSSAALSLVADGVGSSATNFEFDVTTTGTDKFTTLNLKGENNKSYVELDGTAGDVDLATVNGSGDAMVVLGDAQFELVNVTNVNLEASTGGMDIDLATSSNAQNVTVVGGAGNDTVRFAAGQFNTNDNVNLGDGVLDTIITGDAAFTSSTSAVVKALTAASNVEVAGSSVTAANGISVDMSVLTGINGFTFGGITPANNVANAAGDVAASLTFQNDDTFYITGNVIGGTSAVGDSSGGDAINAAAKTNSGSDALNLTFNAASNVTGGASQDTTANGGEAAGDGLDASTVESINIITGSSSADVTFAAGTAAGTDTAGASVRVGANATVTIEGAGDVNLGTLVAPSTATDDLTVNGSAMTGALTVSTQAGNDTITGGSKADTINAGAGTNSLTGNGGSDNFNVTAGDSGAIGSQSVITDFAAGTGGDVLNLTTGADTKSYDALTNAEQQTVSGEATLTAAVNTALTGATDSQWTAFEYGGKSYAVYDTDNTFDTTNGYLIELTGVTVADLVATNFA